MVMPKPACTFCGHTDEPDDPLTYYQNHLCCVDSDRCCERQEKKAEARGELR